MLAFCTGLEARTSGRPRALRCVLGLPQPPQPSMEEKKKTWFVRRSGGWQAGEKGTVGWRGKNKFEIRMGKKIEKWKIAFFRVTLPWADGTAWQRDQEKAMASNGHPLNHDSSNAGVIRSKRTVKQCLGVKRTYNSWSGCQLFLPPGQMSDLGASR